MARASLSSPVKYKEAWNEFSRATFWKIENWVRETLGLLTSAGLEVSAGWGSCSLIQKKGTNILCLKKKYTIMISLGWPGKLIANTGDCECRSKDYRKTYLRRVFLCIMDWIFSLFSEKNRKSVPIWFNISNYKNVRDLTETQKNLTLQNRAILINQKNILVLLVRFHSIFKLSFLSPSLFDFSVFLTGKRDRKLKLIPRNVRIKTLRSLPFLSRCCFCP